MKQLNPYQFYELGAKLHGLFDNRTQNRVADMFAPLTEAQTLLDGFIKGDPFALDTSKADANRLLAKISSIFNRYFIDQTSKQLKASTGEDRIDPHELAMIYSLLEKFEHALAAELNRSPTYVAGKIGIYSTYDLIENAHQVFSKNLLEAIPTSAQNEFDNAGRTLAFGLGTAATMHMLRAIEIALKTYYELFAGQATAKNERNYAAYLKKLGTLADEEENEFRPDKRVVQMLTQIKDHYRNPLITPDTNISIEQATSLFGIASALISLMAEQIGSRQQKKGKGSSKPVAPGPVSAIEEDDEMYEFRISQAG